MNLNQTYMGLVRVFSKSVRHTFRNKRRFVVFLIIFGIVSTIIALNIDELDDLQTTDLLDHKGVVVEKNENADITYSQGIQLYNDIIGYADSSPETEIDRSNLFLYADVDPTLRLNTIEVEDPWLNDFANPSTVQTGRYPNQINEIMVPTASFQTRTLTVGSQTIELTTEITIGQEFTFTNQGGDSITLRVSGTFDDSNHGITNSNDQIWFFMDSEIFEDLLDLLSITNTDVFTYMMTFTVAGQVLFPQTTSSVNTLNDHVKLLLQDEASYGDWIDVPPSLPLEDARQDRDFTILQLIFVVLGGVILSSLFAYLISRFRRREVAILKAMGYSYNSVRTTLIAEILTTSFFGFIIGLSIAQLILVGLVLRDGGDLDITTLIRYQAIGIAFVIMVIVSLPGMVLASARVLVVSPAEAFRDN